VSQTVKLDERRARVRPATCKFVSQDNRLRTSLRHERLGHFARDLLIIDGSRPAVAQTPSVDRQLQPRPAPFRLVVSSLFWKCIPRHQGNSRSSLHNHISFGQTPSIATHLIKTVSHFSLIQEATTWLLTTHPPRKLQKKLTLRRESHSDSVANGASALTDHLAISR